KQLEKYGIGRPSTYATIISTIQTRGYAEKGTSEGVEREVDVLTLSDGAVTSEKVTEKSGADKGKLIPTSSGTVLSDFLNDHFNSIVDYDFTAQLENELDEIADDKLDKTKMLREFYDPFHKLIADADSIDRSDVAKARELGIDPKSGEVVLARVGRFGPMLQLGSSDNPDKKPRFANFPKGVRLEAITLDEALTMFQLPRVVGTTEAGDEIVANIGRFGPYIKVKSLFVSIKSHDPFKITEAEARALYAEKMEAEAQKNVADFGNGLKVLRGRFGPYVTDGAKNAKIPKDEDLEKITGSRAKEILDEAPAKSRRRAPAKKSKKVISHFGLNNVNID
ncbi:MAG: DNA topoisomerase I, partial [Epsilonproteobacteria bacterium]|nr:DNA topoisomerase I [Campylobacterota bacterium]